jgi:hypothetical protein
MTQTEQLDPDTVARAAARLPAILHPPIVSEATQYARSDAGKQTASDHPDGAQRRARATRSDAGTKRVKEPDPTSASLTEQQWARLSVLVETVTKTAVDLRDASQNHSRATAEYRDYLDSLRAK